MNIIKKRWRKRKNHNHACPNPDCDIHGIINHEDVIRNGHQKNEEQEYKCKRCGTRFNRRNGTPLEGLRTPIYVILMAMAMYMCGVGVAMSSDVTGKKEKTVERWIRRIAPHCEGLIKQELSKRNHGFTSLYLQMDELLGYLWRKKTKVWIWIGIDVVTRLFIASKKELMDERGG